MILPNSSYILSEITPSNFPTLFYFFLFPLIPQFNFFNYYPRTTPQLFQNFLRKFIRLMQELCRISLKYAFIIFRFVCPETLSTRQCFNRLFFALEFQMKFSYNLVHYFPQKILQDFFFKIYVWLSPCVS